VKDIGQYLEKDQIGRKEMVLEALLSKLALQVEYLNELLYTE
jgi:hypothetical protein